MKVKCIKCHQTYDDIYRWTICPHNLLEASPDAPHYNCGNLGYCAGHDLFNCTFTQPNQPPRRSYQVAYVHAPETSSNSRTPKNTREQLPPRVRTNGRIAPGETRRYPETCDQLHVSNILLHYAPKPTFRKPTPEKTPLPNPEHTDNFSAVPRIQPTQLPNRLAARMRTVKNPR